MFGFNTKSTQYTKISKKVFDLSNNLGTEVRHTMSRMTGMPEFSQEIIMTASNAATALYEYAALQLRIRLKDTYGPGYEFESQDNQMIDAFSKTLMIPAVALHKILTNKDDPEEWENLLREIPFPGINVDYYINKANDIIDQIGG